MSGKVVTGAVVLMLAFGGLFQALAGAFPWLAIVASFFLGYLISWHVGDA